MTKTSSCQSFYQNRHFADVLKNLKEKTQKKNVHELAEFMTAQKIENGLESERSQYFVAPTVHKF